MFDGSARICAGIFLSIFPLLSHALVTQDCARSLTKIGVTESDRDVIHSAMDDAVVNFFLHNHIQAGRVTNGFHYTVENLATYADMVYRDFVSYVNSSFSQVDALSFLNLLATLPVEVRSSLLLQLVSIKDESIRPESFPHGFTFNMQFDIAAAAATIRRTPAEILYFQAAMMRLRGRSVVAVIDEIERAELAPVDYDPRRDEQFARAAIYVVENFALNRSAEIDFSHYYLFSPNGQPLAQTPSESPVALHQAVELLRHFTYYRKSESAELSAAIRRILHRFDNSQ